MEARNPEENIQIQPNDVISVPWKAELVYVIGAVKRAGGFTLSEREQISVLQALSMAEGLDRSASPANAKILRASEGGESAEIPVDVNRILSGKARGMQRCWPTTSSLFPTVPQKARHERPGSCYSTRTGVAIYRR